MLKNSQIDNDEINLIELIYTVWKGKWKIIAVAVVITLLAFIAQTTYQLTKTNSFTAITEIKPINSLAINKYFALNNTIELSDGNFNSQKITKSNLLNLYIETLNDNSIFEDAMRKLNFLDASQYSDEQEYNEAISKLASSVKILPSLNDKKKDNIEISYQTINFVHDDAKKWKNVLVYVDELTNQLVEKKIVENYNNTLSSLKQVKEYQLEDILIQINNLLIDYEREVFDHMSYLTEQSKIAKKLGIAKSTVEVQTLGNQNALLSNIQTDSPFYLRGYEAIDKEIELIESRNNKKAFIQGLFDLEKKKRAIEQDQIIERTKLAISSVLLLDNDKFSAATIDAITTKFEYKNNKNNKKSRLLAIAIGLIVGVFYVIITNAFQLNRVISKKD